MSLPDGGEGMGGWGVGAGGGWVEGVQPGILSNCLLLDEAEGLQPAKNSEYKRLSLVPQGM